MPASVCGVCYCCFLGLFDGKEGKPDSPTAFFALGGLPCSLARVQLGGFLGSVESLALERLLELTFSLGRSICSID